MVITKAILFLECLTIIGLILAWSTMRRDQIADARRLAWVAILLIPFVFLARDAYIYLALPILLVPLCGRTPGLALAAYLFVHFLMPAMPVPLRVGGTYLLSLTSVDTAGIGLLMALAFNAARLRGRGGRSPGLDGLAIVVMTCFLVMALTAGQGVAARSFVQTVIMVVIPYFAFSRMVRTPEDVRKFWATTLVCGLILAVIALYEGTRHWALYHEVYNIYAKDGVSFSGASLYAKVRGGVMRAPATFAESSALGMFLGMAIVGAIALPGLFRTQMMQWLAILVLGMGLYATVSRGGVAGLLIAVACLSFYRGWSRGTVVTVGLLGAFAAVVFSLSADPSWMNDKGSAFDLADASASYRREFWRLGMEIFRAHPLTGVDQTTMETYMSSLRFEGFIDPIIAYVYWAVRLGVIGPMVLLASALIPILFLFRLRPGLGPSPMNRALAAALVGVGAIMIFQYGVTSIHDRMAVWMMMLIALARALVLPRRGARGVTLLGGGQGAGSAAQAQTMPTPAPIAQTPSV